MADVKLPADVYEESGSRLPFPRREDLSDESKRIYDLHLDPGGGSLAGLRGPGGLRLHSPQLGELTRAASQYLRHETGFSGAIRELAVLVTAREMDSRFEWAAHEPEALRQGLAPDIIDVVKHRGDVDALPETEQVIIRFGRQLFSERRIAPELFARALELFGRRGLVDLVGIMGNYANTALLLAAFDVQLPPGKPAILPVPPK
jgi:4-carboxymuconolactone decarboxylase